MVDAQKSLHSAQSTRTIKSEHMQIKRENIMEIGRGRRLGLSVFREWVIFWKIEKKGLTEVLFT